MVMPSFFPEQPHLSDAFSFVRYIGIFLILYGLVLTLLPLKAKIQAGGPGYDPKKLIVDGIFGHLRHPQIAGALYLSLGVACWQMAVYHLYLNLAYLVVFLIHIRMEEKFLLLPRFGQQYEEYRKKTKALFPFIF